MSLKLHKIYASVFGVGYIKGGGSIAALITCIIWYYFIADFNRAVQVAIFALVSVLGILSGNAVEKDWGEDSSKVVIDEVAGMMMPLLVVGGIWSYVIAFILFRFFDISKIWGIRKMENIKGGMGVMLDDLLSGLYALVVMILILQLPVNL
ncbi:phosphatidylglycerophosphatase A family protein [Polluticaenibacter yanchengensis]|uniref:Phosphatidylglycerophosphatase A n=1 Tax=Polluticaenibacter yanchengensis TaxID=3014562 RepID=A0ABT4UGI1_9BACT|nr:phosphatidylglycerophosphatase A [Chitinophagaceae bacterium LY-5]